MTAEQRNDSKQYCGNCGEPHWLRLEDPHRKYIQPCYVEEVGEDDDGNAFMGVTTLRHRWPAEICPADCPCRKMKP